MKIEKVPDDQFKGFSNFFVLELLRGLFNIQTKTV